jgi:MFS family permease
MVTQQASRRNLIFVSFSQFRAASSFNFLNVFLPFHIFNISPYSFEETLLWIGAILGSSGIVAAVTSPFWGSLTHHFSPKVLYLRGLIAHSIVMLYTATAMIGTYFWGWLSRKYGLLRIITLLFTLSILFQALLALSRGIIDFTLIRMIQTGLVAATLLLIISIFLGEPKGGIIGFLNSARFTGIALGPMIATSILAFSSLEVVCLLISAISLLALLGFMFFFKEPYDPS